MRGPMSVLSFVTRFSSSQIAQMKVCLDPIYYKPRLRHAFIYTVSKYGHTVDSVSGLDSFPLSGIGSQPVFTT